MIKRKHFDFNRLMFTIMNIFFALVLAFIIFTMITTCNYYIIGIAIAWLIAWLIVATAR